MLKVYHGTTQDVAEKIKQVGLIPHRETQFNFQRRDIFGYESPLAELPSEKLPLIYVTPELEYAKQFAEFRTQYMKELPRGKLCNGDLV